MITNVTPDIIAVILSLGNLEYEQNQYTSAEVYYNKAVKFIHELYGKGAAVLPAAYTLYNQGLNYHGMKQYHTADRCFTDAIVVFRKLSQGDDTVQIAHALNRQGINYRLMKQNSNADQCFTEAVDIYRKLSPGDDTEEIANTE